MKIHLSLDDVYQCFLQSKGFRDPLFKYLCRLHENYGARFSLYVQNWDSLKSLKEGCFKELAICSDWMRVGIHTSANGQDFKKCGYEEGRIAWENFVAQIIKLGGVPR